MTVTLPDKPFFTQTEAAKLLGVSYTTLRRMVRDGSLATVVIGQSRPKVPYKTLELLLTKGYGKVA